MKYAETYTPSIVSDSFIYIAHIYFEFWSSKKEKKAKNWQDILVFLFSHMILKLDVMHTINAVIATNNVGMM